MYVQIDIHKLFRFTKNYDMADLIVRSDLYYRIKLAFIFWVLYTE